MLVTESRPRNLHWFHAGPLLYGDWGTSRLYVLGLAFFFTAHGSVLYLAAIGLLMVAVSWAYTIVCRCFPDGGGVYTAARQLSPTLSVFGSTLLLCGYIITAAISTVEAFHYLGVPHEYTFACSVVAMIVLGGVNWFGAKSAGRFAMVIAFAALLVGAVLIVACLPFVPAGIKTISFDTLPPPGEAWVMFTKICLALAGVEAVANMTGLMKKPVEKQAKRTIWPVCIEVVLLNLVFGIALAGLPSLVDIHEPHALRPDVAVLLDKEASDAEPIARAIAAGEPGLTGEEVLAYRDTAMRVIAEDSAAYWGEKLATPEAGERASLIAGKVSGIVFGLLLLSAANTVIMAMVSVLFALAQDRELPRPLTKLNYSGVPSIGLVVAVVAPIAVLVFERDVQRLAELYIIGVCGAITTTVLSVAANRGLDIGRKSRTGLWALGLFLLAVSLTIVVTKPAATIFAGGVIGLVLATRTGLLLKRRGAPDPLDEPASGWLAMVRDEPATINPDTPKIMLAARGRFQSEFAVDLARRRKATLFAVFVRRVSLMDVQPNRVPRVEDDRDAQEALGTTALLAKEAGVPFLPIYVVATDIVDEILDHTVTYGCDTLIMGKTKRSVFARKFEGDVVTEVAESLPDDVALITRSAETPHVGTGRNDNR